MIARRLPTSLIARLMLVLMLACNLTLCLAAYTIQAAQPVAASCHGAVMADDDSQGVQGDCPMPSGVAGALTQLTGGLPSLLLLPLLLCLSLFAPPLLGGTVLRLRRGRARGAPPPSWPRRHLEFCILRN